MAPPAGRGSDASTLFIGQLPYDTNEDEIKEKFDRVGEIRSVRIVQDRDTGKSKGYGFIEFADPADADEALRSMSDLEIGGRDIILNRAGKGGGRGDGGDRGRDGGGRGGGGSHEPNKLFIGKLPFDATERDVEDAFRDAGDILSVRILKDRDTGDSRGFGFIEFAKREDAEEALDKMNGEMIAGTPCRLEPVTAKGGGKGGGGGGRGGRRDDSRSRSRSRSRRRPPPRGPPRGRSRSFSPGPRGGGGGRGGYGGGGGGYGRDRPPPRRADSRDPPPRDGYRGGKGGGRDRGGYGRDDMDGGDRGRGGYRDDMDGRGPPPRRAQRRGGNDSRSRDASSGSRPAGVPKKKKAVEDAQLAFEDADAAYLAVRKKADSIKAQLDKAESAAESAVAKKVLKLKKTVKAELVVQIDRMKKESDNALADALEESEVKLDEELQEKLQAVKREFAARAKDENEKIKAEHDASAAEAEKMLTQQSNDKIQAAEEKAQEEEAPLDLRDDYKKAMELVEDEEEKRLSAKKRLESLTGVSVRDRDVPPPRDREGGGRDEGRVRDAGRREGARERERAADREDAREREGAENNRRAGRGAARRAEAGDEDPPPAKRGKRAEGQEGNKNADGDYSYYSYSDGEAPVRP